MHYTLSHQTCYTYRQPVVLGSHCLKLCPRNDGAQQLTSFNLEISPTPKQRTRLIDPEGNICERLWFEKTPVTTFKIVTQAEVETTRTNPFDYWAAPWALKAPIDYPSSSRLRLSPYLNGSLLHPQVIEFAYDLLSNVTGNVSTFLTQLTQIIYDRCQYVYRLEGDPQSAAITLTQKAGTCRDFAVLWIEACRAVGLAARFVSGYQKGDPNQAQHELHAWAEAYVPGGGWRGYDPTLGLAVADGHIAVAAAADPRFAAPVIGQIQPVEGQTETILDCQIKLSFQ